MAITRAQQARQMYKKGSMPVEQAGVMNYMPSEMVTVPKIAKSSPDTPTAKLAYITPEEENILVDLNLYGSLKGKPNKGPGGIPSLEGSFGDPEGKSGNVSGPGFGDVGPSNTVGGRDTSAFTDKGTGRYTVSTKPQDRQTVIDYAKGKMDFQGGKKPGFFSGPGTLSQRRQVYNIQQRLNAIDRYTKSRRNKVLAGLTQLGITPSYDDPEETFADLVTQAPSITGMTDKYSPQTIADVLAGKRQIDFFSEIDLNQVKGLGTKGLAALANLVGPAMAGPVTQEKLTSLLGEIDTLQSLNPADTTTKELMKTFSPNQYETIYGNKDKDGRGDPQFLPVSSQVASTPVEEEDYYASVGGNPFANRNAYRLFNNGGIVTLEQAKEMAPPGESLAYINDDEADLLKSLGGAGEDINGTGIKSYFYKAAKKAVKKVTKTVKKIAKSPIGKAALLAAGGYYLGGGSLFGLQRAGMTGFKFANIPGFMSAKNFMIGKPLPFKTAGDSVARSGGLLDLIGGKAGLGILGASALAGLMTPKQEEEEEEGDFYRGEGLDIDAIRANPFEFVPRRFAATGGRMGYAGGTVPSFRDYLTKQGLNLDELDANIFNIMQRAYDRDYPNRPNKLAEGGKPEPVAKKTMPLLDMDGQEMDLRAEGGFVPIGRMEKADDVPARLSKNEFVFTAEAVRNAGEGDVDKGAEVMYNMMKNLESGGDVSEESQGLKGARDMFQTSQRLEEVL